MMPQWLHFLSSELQGRRVFVWSADIRAVKETADNSSIITLDCGVSFGVTANSLTIMAKISDPPARPSMVARVTNPNDTVVPVNGGGEPWASVQVKDGATIVGTAQVDATGVWEVVLNLAPGEHSLTATQTNIFGLTSKASDPMSLVIAVPAPPPPPPPPPAPEPPPAPAPAPVEQPAAPTAAAPPAAPAAPEPPKPAPAPEPPKLADPPAPPPPPPAAPAAEKPAEAAPDKPKS